MAQFVRQPKPPAGAGRGAGVLLGMSAVFFACGLALFVADFVQSSSLKSVDRSSASHFVRLHDMVVSADGGGSGEDTAPEAECTAEAFEAFQKDPTLPLERICEATPWLLPPRTPALSYAGMEGEEELLALRAQPFGRHNWTISLFPFSADWALLVQNYVYSAVRFAGVRNHVAMTWTPEDHEACLDLNLPCWNVTRFLPWRAARGEAPEAQFGSAEYNAITWVKVLAVAHLVERGYVVHLSDVDVSYTTKPLWASYLRYIEDGGADAAMAHETSGGSNSGNYVVLPTPGGRAFMRCWADSALKYNDTNDQWALGRLHSDSEGATHAYCKMPLECAAKRAGLLGQGRADTALVRHYTPGWMFGQHQDYCFFMDSGNVRQQPADPCHFSMLYVHILCRGGIAPKIDALKAAEFWYLDDRNLTPRATRPLPRPAPMRWADPHWEDAHLYCLQLRDTYPLAFTYIPYWERQRQAQDAEHAQAQGPAPAESQQQQQQQAPTQEQPQARAVKAWLQEVFDTSFRTRRHGEAGGGNGAGSTLEATAHTRKLLAGLILRLNASSLIDVGCGTMFWQPALLQEVWAARPGFRYLGVDIAAAVLEQNRRDHPAQNDTFRLALFDATSEPLPAGYDLVLLRDTLQHLPCRLVVDVLQNAAASGAARLLVGSYDGTNNADVAAGEYFSINLQEPPYSLQQPAEVLDEQSGGKRLLLYELGGLQGEDWDGMRARCSADKDKGGG